MNTSRNAKYQMAWNFPENIAERRLPSPMDLPLWKWRIYLSMFVEVFSLKKVYFFRSRHESNVDSGFFQSIYKLSKRWIGL